MSADPQSISDLAPKRVRLAPNGTNLGLFRSDFSTFWLGEPEKSQIWLQKLSDWPQI